jgi:hypothetical protein
MTLSQYLRQLVRERARFMCEYCGVTEASTAAELTIDHFHSSNSLFVRCWMMLSAPHLKLLVFFHHCTTSVIRRIDRRDFRGNYQCALPMFIPM